MTDNQDPESVAHRIELEARDWVVRLTSGKVNESDLDSFHAWRNCHPEHRAAFERERLFWRQLEALPVEAPPTPAAKQQPVLGRRGLLVGGAALAATGLMLAPRLHRWWISDFVAPVGEQMTLSLPDGSSAYLNSGSALRVAYGPDLRLVALTSGEAEFSVKPAKDGLPFRLAMLGGNTDMFVGRFVARIEDNSATISISEEHAEVFGPAEERAQAADFPDAVRISKNQQTTYSLGEVPTTPIGADMELTLAWRQQKIIFEGKAFSGAIEEIGRYLREPVFLRPGIDRNLPVSGIFSTRAPIAALEALAKTQALTVRRIPGVAILVT